MHNTGYRVIKDMSSMYASLLTFAQAANLSCTVNGEPVDCAELVEKVKPFLGIGLGLVALLVILIIISFVFWFWMLVHALNHNSPNRTTWIVLLIVSFILGFNLVAAIIYYFVEKKKAEEATSVTTPPVVQQSPLPPQQPSSNS